VWVEVCAMLEWKAGLAGGLTGVGVYVCVCAFVCVRMCACVNV
jgi:hypothetical protein